MAHPQQDQCINYLRALARTGDLRVAMQGQNCHYFVSDRGAQMLKDTFGIEPSPTGHVQQIFKDYNLGKTNHHIPRESLTEIVGRFGLGDGLRDLISPISKQQSQRDEGRA